MEVIPITRGYKTNPKVLNYHTKDNGKFYSYKRNYIDNEKIAIGISFTSSYSFPRCRGFGNNQINQGEPEKKKIKATDQTEDFDDNDDFEDFAKFNALQVALNEMKAEKLKSDIENKRLKAVNKRMAKRIDKLETEKEAENKLDENDDFEEFAKFNALQAAYDKMKAEKKELEKTMHGTCKKIKNEAEAEIKKLKDEIQSLKIENEKQTKRIGELETEREAEKRLKEEILAMRNKRHDYLEKLKELDESVFIESRDGATEKFQNKHMIESEKEVSRQNCTDHLDFWLGSFAEDINGQCFSTVIIDKDELKRKLYYKLLPSGAQGRVDTIFKEGKFNKYSKRNTTILSMKKMICYEFQGMEEKGKILTGQIKFTIRRFTMNEITVDKKTGKWCHYNGPKKN